MLAFLGVGQGMLFPVGEDNFLWGKSSQSGKRVISLEVARGYRVFGAWKLLVFTQG
jgi:hypothetical protein